MSEPRRSDVSDEELTEWLRTVLSPVDKGEAIARVRAAKAEALQSPFQNCWFAGGQVPQCEALGHRIYHWSHKGWQVFQHGNSGEARFAHFWDGRSLSDSEEAYLEDWNAMLELVRQWTDEIHAWEAHGDTGR